MVKPEKVSIIGEIDIAILNLAGYQARQAQAEHECNVHKIQESCYEVGEHYRKAQDTAEQIGKLLVQLFK